MQVGDTLAEVGVVADAALLSVIYTSGVSELFLSSRPRVAILTSGDELTGAAGSSQVRDSNGPALAALALSEGASVVAVEQVGDDASATRAAVAP
jgi:molybdopterin molybdotransferase